LSATERRLVELWIGLRVFTLIWAALTSGIRPLTPREQAIPLWPPSSPYLTWAERVVVAPWERWDAHNYVYIVERGYRNDDGTAQFHPLLPLLAKLFFWSPALGLLIVSSAASLLFVLVFYRLADLDIPNPETATKLMLAFPVSFILFAPYTESLWLLFAALSFWYARKDRWWASGAAGAMATLARQQGIFLVLPLGYELWARGERRSKSWVALALIPLALLGWITYRGVFLSDVHPDFSSVNSLLYTTILTPSSAKVVQQQAMLPPWEALWKAIAITQTSSTRGNLINLILAALMVILAALAWRHMRVSYKILTVVLFAVAFGYHTGPQTPYMGLPRHLLLAFPIFIGAAPALERFKGPIAAVFTICMLLLASSYVLEVWVP
jgi:Gpi18-like mannosyltransferase